MDRELLEQLFKEWILENWDEKYHNFSKRDNGEYWLYSMQDAWEVWVGCHLAIKKVWTGE